MNAKYYLPSETIKKIQTTIPEKRHLIKKVLQAKLSSLSTSLDLSKKKIYGVNRILSIPDEQIKAAVLSNFDRRQEKKELADIELLRKKFLKTDFVKQPGVYDRTLKQLNLLEDALRVRQNVRFSQIESLRDIFTDLE